MNYMTKILKSRIFIVIIASLICVGCLMLYTQSINKKAEIIKVVKITANIEPGTEITKDMIEIADVGSYGITDFITDTKEVVGKYSTIGLQKGDILTSKKLTSSSVKSETTLNNLDGSYVAFSVTVKEPADSLSDKLRSGDIVSTYIFKDGQSSVSDNLKYVKVLAVTTKDGVDKDNDSVSESIATVMLLVTPQQALELTKFEDSAEIHFALVYRGNNETSQQFLDKQKEVLDGD